MSASRRIAAFVAGFVQAMVGLVLGLVSVTSLDLVGGGDFAINWVLAVPAGVLLAGIGLTVARVAGRRQWLRDGGAAAGLAIVLALAAGYLGGSAIGAGLVFVACQFAPAVLPDPSATAPSAPAG